MTATTQAFESADMRAVIRERDEAIRIREGVTVCVPCFNQWEFLPSAIDSLLNQTVKPIEILVIDDGSTDRPTFNAEAWPTVQVVRITNRGLASARNTGLMLARGKAFLPLDADDTIRDDYIEKTLPLLKDHDVVLTGIQEVGVRTGCYEPGFDMPWWQVEESHLWQMNRFFYCSLHRTESLRSVGGYNPKMHWGWEDYDVWLDYMRRGYRFNACLEPLFIYRTTHDGMMARCARDHREELIAEMKRHHLTQ